MFFYRCCIVAALMSFVIACGEDWEIPHDVDPVYWQCDAELEVVIDNWEYGTYELPAIEVCANEQLSTGEFSDLKALCAYQASEYFSGKSVFVSVKYDPNADLTISPTRQNRLTGFSWCELPKVCESGVPGRLIVNDPWNTTKSCAEGPSPEGYIAPEARPYNTTIDDDQSAITVDLGSAGKYTTNILNGSVGMELGCADDGTCQLVLLGLELSVENIDLQHSSTTLENPEIHTTGIPRADYNKNTKEFTIPIGGLKMVANFHANGEKNGDGNILVENDSEIVGVFDPDNDTFEFNTRLYRNGTDNYIDITYVADSFEQKPPTSVIVADSLYECQSDYQATVFLDGTQSIYGDADGGNLTHEWYIGTSSVLDEPSGTISLPVGQTLIVQLVRASRDFASSSAQYITVMDSTPPSIDVESVVIERECALGPEIISIDLPNVTDSCTDDSTITLNASVIKKDGLMLSEQIPVDIENRQVELSQGTYIVRWVATDEHGMSQIADQEITVVGDSVPPEMIVSSQDITNCSPGANIVGIEWPNVSDNCSENDDISVNGLLKESNGESGGMVEVYPETLSLPPGVHVIEWHAFDENGNETIAEQTIVLSAGITAYSAFDLEVGANVRDSQGGFSAVVNGGALRTRFDVESQSGDVFSVAPVDLRDRVAVHDVIYSQGSVTFGDDVDYVSYEEYVPINVPAKSISSFVVPNDAEDYKLEPESNDSRSPGYYKKITVERGSVLTLSPGQYFVEELILEPGSTIESAGVGSIGMYVKNTLIVRGQLPNGVFVGYIGSADVTIEAEMSGIIIAPNALIQFGCGSFRPTIQPSHFTTSNWG